MAGTIVPFTFVPGKTNLSDFRTLTRPLRAMGVRKEWVYNQVAVDWAQLDGQTQKLVYAKACITDLAPKIWQDYWDVWSRVWRGLTGFMSSMALDPASRRPSGITSPAHLTCRSSWSALPRV